jgi:hypothetical protein
MARGNELRLHHLAPSALPTASPPFLMPCTPFSKPLPTFATTGFAACPVAFAPFFTLLVACCATGSTDRAVRCECSHAATTSASVATNRSSAAGRNVLTAQNSTLFGSARHENAKRRLFELGLRARLLTAVRSARGACGQFGACYHCVLPRLIESPQQNIRRLRAGKPKARPEHETRDGVNS